MRFQWKTLFRWKQNIPQTVWLHLSANQKEWKWLHLVFSHTTQQRMLAVGLVGHIEPYYPFPNKTFLCPIVVLFIYSLLIKEKNVFRQGLKGSHASSQITSFLWLTTHWMDSIWFCDIQPIITYATTTNHNLWQKKLLSSKLPIFLKYTQLRTFKPANMLRYMRLSDICCFVHYDNLIADGFDSEWQVTHDVGLCVIQNCIHTYYVLKKKCGDSYYL